MNWKTSQRKLSESKNNIKNRNSKRDIWVICKDHTQFYLEPQRKRGEIIGQINTLSDEGWEFYKLMRTSTYKFKKLWKSLSELNNNHHYLYTSKVKMIKAKEKVLKATSCMCFSLWMLYFNEKIKTFQRKVSLLISK